MVPWDRTPAGIGSPGVRVLYGMKNGKAGMMLTIRDYRAEDLADAAAIWNAIVEQGDSFPGDAVFAAGRKRTASSVPRPDGRWRWTAANGWVSMSSIRTTSAGVRTSPTPPMG